MNLQNWGTGIWHFAHQKAVVERDGDIQWTIGAFGTWLAKVNQHVSLAGPGGQAQVNGVMFTEGKQHLSYHTLQRHQAPHCTSNLLYKGALPDQSRLVWRGMIEVDRDAQKTDGYQRDDNLMLSEDAGRLDPRPGNRGRRRGNALTGRRPAGSMTSRSLHARCRGLTRKEAVRMIVAGFFQRFRPHYLGACATPWERRSGGEFESIIRYVQFHSRLQSLPTSPIPARRCSRSMSGSSS